MIDAFVVDVAVVDSSPAMPWIAVSIGVETSLFTTSGEAPETVWRDPARVRRHYAEAIDYSLRVVMDYARRHAGDPPLMIVLGDHQTAPGIALDPRPDVPVHVIGPARLVERSAAWGLTPGLVPAPDAVALPMDRMRDLILRGFTDPRPQS